jgi:hypothetical protein
MRPELITFVGDHQTDRRIVFGDRERRSPDAFRRRE